MMYIAKSPTLKTIVSPLCLWSLLLIACVLLGAGCQGKSDDDPPAAPTPTPTMAPTPTELKFEFDPMHVRQISIEMDPAVWDEIRHTARSPEILLPRCEKEPVESPYEYVPATVTVDGETLENVGVRTKGWWGSVNPVRPSLKIEFDEFVEDQRLGGLERMTLNNNNHDFSRMHTCFAYQVFRDAGYPAPECEYGHVTVNGTDLGVYSVVEPIKKSFLRKWFDSDEGNLYESQLSDFAPYNITSWERKTNKKTADDRSDIEAVMAALEPNDDLLLSRLGEVIDLDQFYTYWAIETLISFWDSYNSNRNNFYIYNDPGIGKFVFIPWGADDAFTSKSTFLTVNSNGPLFANSVLSNTLYANPEARQKFKTRLTELYSVIWGNDRLQQQVSHVQKALEPFISQKFNPNFVGAAQTLQAFMNELSTRIETQLVIPDQLPDYPYPPAQKCLYELAEPQPFSVSFSAIWGLSELFGDNPSTVSEFSFPGIEHANLQYASVSVAPTLEEDLGGLGNVMMKFYLLPTMEDDTLNGDLVGIMFTLSPQQYQTGNVVIENLTTCGTGLYLSNFNDRNTARLRGIVTGGHLELTQTGMEPGEPVSGTFSGEIVWW